MSENAAIAPPPPVVILAGGFGTRIRHLLPDRPKPMAPVLGRPFVEWVVRFFAKQGCTDFTLSTGHMAGTIAFHFEQQPVPGVRVACRPESTPLGTAGGFLNCVPADLPSSGAWLVVNGDSMVFADYRPLLEPLESGRADSVVLGLALPDASRYGTLEVGPGDRLISFREKRAGAGVINSGVYAFSWRAIRAMPAQRPLSFETDVFPAFAATGRISVAQTSAAFLDIGTPASLAEAERFITQNQHEFLP
jgi:D-glycero-alpha-D-manno-heptose 1-phosphate guanylyltransferase